MADLNNYPNPHNNVSQDDNQPLLAGGGGNPYLYKTADSASVSSLDKIKKDKAVLTFDKAMVQAGGMGIF